MNSVVIIGNRISGLLSGAWLKKKHPELEVLVLGPPGDRIPLVGESTIEASFSFLEQLGLGEYLREHHKPKHGLTFYYKLKPDDVDDSRYSVHETVERPRTVTANINRELFDVHLRAFAEELGVRFDGRLVKQIDFGPHDRDHVLHLEDGEQRTARWIIDASGRSSVVAKHLRLLEKPSCGPRNTFWFRLSDYDPAAWLAGVDQLKPEQDAHDSFHCTHHFMGRGHWIWGIPISSKDGRSLISIGITWRPDLCPFDVRNVDDFVEHVGKIHPFLADFVRSGTAEDVSTYRNYLRRSTRVYSSDRWFLVGDAAATVDPLYSTGMLFTTLAIQQIEAMIVEDQQGKLDPDFVDALDACFRINLDALQSSIGRQYEVMHDPYRAHLMMHWDTAEYMYLFLPMLSSGLLWNPSHVRQFLKKDAFEEPLIATHMRNELLSHAVEKLGHGARERIRYLYDESAFYDFSIDDCDVPRALSRGLWFRARLRYQLLKDARGRGLVRHGRQLLDDVVGATALRVLKQRALDKMVATAAATPIG